MNRIDRISAILIQLQSKKLITASEIADRFNISKRTVYRDIKTLEEAGVPLGAEAGKGYFIADGYHLPPVMFTREEAGALLIGEKFIEKLTDESVGNYFKSALYKIKSVLRYNDKEYVESLDKKIKVHYMPYDNSSQKQSLPWFFILQRAIADQKVLFIDYKSNYKNELTKNRAIEPVGICFYSLHWHLIAYCLLRKDFRDFRIDRITNCIMSERTFDEIPERTLSTYYEKLSSQQHLNPVSISFEKNFKKYIDQQKFYYGFVHEKEIEEKIQVDFLTYSIPAIAKWILTLNFKVTIIEPLTLNQIITENIKQMKEFYL